jgi:hypothetical protein
MLQQIHGERRLVGTGPVLNDHHEQGHTIDEMSLLQRHLAHLAIVSQLKHLVVAMSSSLGLREHQLNQVMAG